MEIRQCVFVKFIHLFFQHLFGLQSISLSIQRETVSPDVKVPFLSFLFSMPFFNTASATGGVACWAIKTGCPLIGVCLPSFFGYWGAILILIKSIACCLIVSIPLFWIYCRSFSASLNLDLNLDLFRDARVLILSQSIIMNIQMNLISPTALYKAFKSSI
jgi:hypothetical protein